MADSLSPICLKLRGGTYWNSSIFKKLVSWSQKNHSVVEHPVSLGLWEMPVDVNADRTSCLFSPHVMAGSYMQTSYGPFQTVYEPCFWVHILGSHLTWGAFLVSLRNNLKWISNTSTHGLRHFSISLPVETHGSSTFFRLRTPWWIEKQSREPILHVVENWVVHCLASDNNV